MEKSRKTSKIINLGVPEKVGPNSNAGFMRFELLID